MYTLPLNFEKFSYSLYHSRFLAYAGFVSSSAFCLFSMSAYARRSGSESRNTPPKISVNAAGIAYPERPSPNVPEAKNTIAAAMAATVSIITPVVIIFVRFFLISSASA